MRGRHVGAERTPTLREPLVRSAAARATVRPSPLHQLPCLCLRENDDELTAGFSPADETASARQVAVRVTDLLSSNDGEVMPVGS